MRIGRVTVPTIGAAALIAVASAPAEYTYDFEDLPVNTIVTTQYKGVTISTVGNSCGGNPPIYMRIQSPSGTSSGFNALGIDGGCGGGFSNDYLRMIFDDSQGYVSFVLGVGPGNFLVRAYSTVSGGTAFSTQFLNVPDDRVSRFVRIATPADNIKRVEVESTVGLFEYIDDLTFEVDSTPPIVEIDDPNPFACVCDPVAIIGVADDPDGTFANAVGAYSADPNGPWTLFGLRFTPQPGGTIFTWQTDMLSERWYFLRVTANNDTDLSSSVTTTYWASQDFDKVNFSTPPIVSGLVCLDGTVQDVNCGETYRADVRQQGSILYQPVDPTEPTYSGQRVNQTLAVWNTRTGNVPDGQYWLRVSGTNDCQQTKEMTQAVIVDNTFPTATIVSYDNCDRIVPGMIAFRGTADDANLRNWSLQYTGGALNRWININTGTTPVLNGLLGVWDTSNLQPCAYTVRLLVNDEAVEDCNPLNTHQTEYDLTVNVGCPADFDLNGVQDVLDLLEFLSFWFEACP